jgi:hypothetical protein
MPIIAYGIEHCHWGGAIFNKYISEIDKFINRVHRNFCKFSCTSGIVYHRAYECRAWPRDPGNEDAILQEKFGDSQLGLHTEMMD